MSKVITYLILFLVLIITNPYAVASAAENPLAVANNKIGIHVLSDSELSQAAKLVNSNGGDWGYVLIPIQAGDKDIVKWQKFLDDCKQNRVIPLLRLATESDNFNTVVWREPTAIDIIDFANFLNSLEWPTKNRYVIVFNEVNRGDEWGGKADPAKYAEILSFAASVFKSKSPDFFIISAGLDNAAPDQGTQYMNQYTYLTKMNQAVPGIFNQIDGVSSHSYPNPGFSQPPNTNNPKGVASFAFERELIKQMSQKPLPIFITETGWASDVVPEDVRVKYYDETLKTIWNDKDIVAITPFLLQAGAGPFEKFTFIATNGTLTKQYKYIESLPKIKGVPSFPTRKTAEVKGSKETLGAKDFSEYEQRKRSFSMATVVTDVFNFIIGKE